MTVDRSADEAYRFAVTVTCNRCEKRVDGDLMFSAQNQVVDTRGFMVFAEPPGAVCDSCLGEDPA